MTAPQPIDFDELEFKRYQQQHAHYIHKIKALDERLDELAPYEISKLEYFYTKAERIAWHIAGWHKNKYKYYEGMAEVYQGQEYKNVRQNGGTGTDGQYESRITKGNMLVEASQYEGDYVSWKGIAQTYERAANALKDVIRAIEKQGGE